MRTSHQTTGPVSSPSATSATIMPFTSEEKCHNGFNQPRPKRRVHPPPEAFLSLIRRASSCLQTQNLLTAMMAGLLTNTDSKSRKSYPLTPDSKAQHLLPRRCRIEPSSGMRRAWPGFGLCRHTPRVPVSSQQFQIHESLIKTHLYFFFCGRHLNRYA